MLPIEDLGLWEEACERSIYLYRHTLSRDLRVMKRIGIEGPTRPTSRHGGFRLTGVRAALAPVSTAGARAEVV